MILDGKKIAAEILSEIGRTVAAMQGRKPSITFILVGNHPSSQSYVRAKRRACTEIHITSSVIELPTTIAEVDLISQIEQLNRDPFIDAILIQLPLPPHIDEKEVMSAIDPTKDVDGFHPINVGKMLLGEEGGFLPCTPNGIRVLLERAEIPVEGKHVVIVGRSNIVGKPLAAILMQKKRGCNATVTIAHSRSENLAEITRSADILVAAIGQPQYIKKEMVKPGSVVIDVGNNWIEKNRLVGDVDYASVSPIASYITPVPGGVGPMTIAMLMLNTVESGIK